MNETKPANNVEQNETSEEVSPAIDKTNQKPAKTQEPKDWKDKFLEMDLLSPIYIFLFIILFSNNKDGIDLHDAIIDFILTYNS